MNRALPYLIFYGIFFAVMYAVHLYVAFRLKSSFGMLRTSTLMYTAAVLALSFPLCSLIEKFYPSALSRLLYTTASVWLGVVFLLLSLLLALEPVRRFLPITPLTIGIGILAAAGLLSLYALINAFAIRVRTVEIPLPNLHQPLRAVLLSDIHVGTIHNAGYLKRIVSTTNALQPDMVLITGDLFDGTGPVSRHTVEPLKKFKAKTFFTIGNHERYDGVERVMDVLADSGLTVLRNEVFAFRGIQLVGIDFYEREGRKDNPFLHRLSLDRDMPSVLMYHPPSGIEDAQRAGINLQVSGHTHNGQLFPFTLLVKAFYKYTQGLYKINGMYLYVTPGTGTWGPPMRLGSRSEITLLKLVPG